MPTFLFDKVNRVITVKAPDTEVTIQQLINTIRDWEDELVNTEVPKVADASGKDDLGGGLQVGITLKLLNWKVKFEDRSGPNYIDCGVSGGNLVAVDANNQSMNPIAPAAYVTVTVAKAVSAALIAAIAEWTQTQKDSLFADTGTLKTDTTTIKTEIDKVQHSSAGEYERDKESLEAIREAIDKISVAKGFRI